MLNSCGIYYWGSNSVIRHATSPSPLTVPFTPKEIVWPAFSHEPDVIRAPTGEYVAFITHHSPPPILPFKPCNQCSLGNSSYDIITKRGGCGPGLIDNNNLTEVSDLTLFLLLDGLDAYKFLTCVLVFPSVLFQPVHPASSYVHVVVALT